MMRSLTAVMATTVLAAGILVPMGTADATDAAVLPQVAAAGTLKVRLAKAPAKSKVRVKVVGLAGKGIGQRRTVKIRSTKRLALPKGRYRVTPRPVTKKGRTYTAQPARRVVTVRGGRTTPANFRFRAPSAPLQFTNVSAGDALTCAVTTGTRGYCWGNNESAQLGNGGTFVRSATPVALAPPRSGWRQMAAAYPCGRRVDGGLWCWGVHQGDPRGGPLGSTEPSDSGLDSFIEIDGSCGQRVGIEPGTVCWRAGYQGGWTYREVAGSEGLTGVSGRYSGGCGLDVVGHSWCWSGAGAFSVATPVTLREVSVGGAGQVCGVTDLGQLWCWQIGQTLPAKLDVAARFTDISMGGTDRATGCALDLDQHAWCWGALPGATSTPTRVRGGHRFTSITVGNSHVCALAGTKAWCWGSNADGELGDGTTTTRLSPTAVVGPY